MKFLRNLKDFILKLKVYLPILWRDRDYDFSYLLKILEVKTRLMSEHIKEHDICESSSRSAKELKIVSELCRRIQEDDYRREDFGKLDERFGEITIGHEPSELEGWSRMIISREKIIEGSAEEKLEQDLMKRLYKAKENCRKTDLEYLTKLINRKLWNWWD